MAQIDASFLEQTHPESLNPERQNLPLSNLESLDQLPAKVILIGEDVKSDRNQLHECFVGTQHLLLFAQDGWDTIRIAQDFPVDIILLNFHIPKLTSDQVMQVLRQQIVATATPVILLESLATAQNFEHLQEHLKIPIQATLRKPIDPSQLLTTFSQIFRT
jgi:CheY-like chemotaxis protein